jgi:dihydroorotase
MRDNKITSREADVLRIRNVDLWTSKSVKKSVHLLIKNGIVEKITEHFDALPKVYGIEIDGKGLVLMPAGIDAQVHLRVPGQEQKETATSGLWAAVAGGVGALLTMPNTKPVLDNVETLELARQIVEGPQKETGVHVLFSAAMTIGQRGLECVDFEGLARAGIAAFTDDGVGVAQDQVMFDVLKGSARTGLPVLQHAEIPGHGGVLAPGPVQEKMGGPAYLPHVEVDMVKRDLTLLEEIPNARYHVLHVSSKDSLAAIQSAKSKGLSVTCEVSPHHLYFTSEEIDADNSSFKMNPPIRSKHDQIALQDALEAGLCDFMATDHAPHEPTVKSSNFKTSAFGTTGLETSLRVLIDLWQKNKLSASRLVDVWSTAPAKFLGLSRDYGDIAEGLPFRAVLCDVHSGDRLVMEQDFLGLSKNSCFIGTRLPGTVLATLLGTKVHCLNGFQCSPNGR